MTNEDKTQNFAKLMAAVITGIVFLLAAAAVIGLMLYIVIDIWDGIL